MHAQDDSTAVARTPVEGDLAKGVSFVGLLMGFLFAVLMIAAVVLYDRWNVYLGSCLILLSTNFGHDAFFTRLDRMRLCRGHLCLRRTISADRKWSSS